MSSIARVLPNRRDWRSVVFILVTLALIGVQWTGVLRHPALLAATFCFTFLSCVINHNHQHHNTFFSAALNRVFGVFVTWAIGQPATAILPMHMFNHHVHNGRSEDLVRPSLIELRSNLLNLALFPFAAARAFLKIKKRELADWKRRRPGLYRRLIVERWAFYPAVLTMLAFSPAETLLFAILPWLFGQWGIVAINHLQHDGCDPDSEYDHSRNFVGRWLNWWVFNNGYHTVHHLEPRRHWSELPRRHAEISHRISPHLDERSLFLAFCRFYLKPGGKPRLKEVQR